eukprot:938364-Amphidinium_carterae.1
MRAENFERLRRRLESDFERTGDKAVDYDPRKPWNSVFRAAIADTEYWAVVARKSVMFLTSLKTTQAVQDDGTAQPEIQT